MHSRLVTVFILVIGISVASCLRCYVCSSLLSDDCLDKPEKDELDDCDRTLKEPVCMKTETESDGNRVVIRDCADGKEAKCTTTDGTNVQHTVCYCNTEDCNGGTSLLVGRNVFLIPLLATLINQLAF